MLYITTHFIRISYKAFVSGRRMQDQTYNLPIYIHQDSWSDKHEWTCTCSELETHPQVLNAMKYSVTAGKLITDTDTSSPYHKLKFHVLWQVSLTTGYRDLLMPVTILLLFQSKYTCIGSYLSYLCTAASQSWLHIMALHIHRTLVTEFTM